MEIKGTAVKSIPEHVRAHYPDRYKEWLDSLPAESQKIFKEGVITANWYDVDKAAIIPTQKVGELFFNNANKGAWQSGRYSAEQALNGIYKLYVKFSSPGHIIERASRVFSAYYSGSEMQVVNKEEKSVEVEIVKFSKPNQIIEHRIGGWMERALEISGCKDVKVVISKSLAKGDAKTLYNITWPC
ncbi:MAG: hypothetical protein IPO21_10755 [Bacteroidales bacterium]|nr:hypothetical protein [Bacteroidales bacterium]